jgi:RNA polymerase sigma-70 factor (ECF subfamily)
VYAFARRSGYDADQAKDLTQSFFARVIEKRFFAEARRDRGRFRPFLLASLKHFLANEYASQSAQKRGGGRRLLPLEFNDGERTYLREPATDVTPESLYERRWALSVIEAAMARVRASYADVGREELFSRLRQFLTGEEPSSYAAIAAEIGSTDGALRVAVHRLRRHFARSLRDVVSETVETSEEVENELQYLMAALSR